MEPVIVIPAYEPTTTLVTLVDNIRQHSPTQPIVVINDGSSAEALPIFEQLHLSDSVTVLRHAVNLGKGQALKTAFNHVLNTYGTDCPGVITADADGQHATEDILKVSTCLKTTPHTLWIGARAFDKNVPFKSQLGNTVTRNIFRLLIGKHIYDTQSGLRGIPYRFLKHLLKLRAHRYDFELDMLVEAAALHMPIEETRIATIYIDNNRASHFHPLLDSLRVYFVFLRFCALSLVTALIDFLVFTLVFLLYPSIIVSFLCARGVAGSFNFIYGKRLIFKSTAHILPEAVKFSALVIGLMCISYVLVLFLHEYLGVPVIASKLIAEVGLFLFSFAAQRLFVFSKSHQGAFNLHVD